MKTLPTQNIDWGFWGTTKNIVKTDKATKKAWDEAFTLIREIAEFTPLETVAFLDSRWGRHTADQFSGELKDGTFAAAFKKKLDKAALYKSYNYYVDPNAYRVLNISKDEMFCKELAALSKKYGIVLQAVGGVQKTAAGFIGYNSDLDSGDLMPIWEG